MSMANPAVAAPVDEVERVIFSECASVLEHGLRVDDGAAMAAHGYDVEPPDEEGPWASRTFDGYKLRIGQGGPGCRVRFDGAEMPAIYEALLERLVERGFAFADGKRKPAAGQVVLDMLTSEQGPIGQIAMLRLNLPRATSFAVTVFPPVSENK